MIGWWLSDRLRADFGKTRSSDTFENLETPDGARRSFKATRIPLSLRPINSFKIPSHTFTMASRPAARALRQSARQLAAPAVQKRTFVSALNAARSGVAAAPKAAVASSFQQVRGIKTIDFAGTKETVYGSFFHLTQSWTLSDPFPQSVPTGPRRSSW